MKNALILHGTGGNSQDSWCQWLKKELEQKGYKVWTPDLPDSYNPNINRYNQFIFSQWKFDEDSIIVGHSSGAVVILPGQKHFSVSTAGEKYRQFPELLKYI